MHGEAFNVFCQAQLFRERQCHLQQQGSIKNAALAFLLTHSWKLKDITAIIMSYKVLQKEVNQTSYG